MKISRLSHKTRFNVSCVIFYGFSCDFMPVSYGRCFGRLVRFIRPGFDTWCSPATVAGKKRKCSAAPVMLHRRSRERHGGSRRRIGFLKSGLMIYWRYPVTGFLNSRSAITASPPDSQQVRAGFGNL